jgi:hypothetical protein
MELTDGSRRPRRRWGADLGYEVRYRMQLVLLTFFGSAQLDAENDPLTRLRRERQQRLARRRADESE